MDARFVNAADRPQQDVRWRFPEQTIDILKMPPEQLIEQVILTGVAVVAIPPAPVAPLGDVEFAPRFVQRDFVELAASRLLLEELAGQMQHVPRLPVLRMADPDVEVRIDPATRVQLVQPLGSGSRFQVVTDPHRFHIGMTDRLAVQCSQEDDAAIAIVFPAILAVKDHRHDHRGVALVSPHGTPHLCTRIQHMVSRRDRVLALGLKSNEVAQAEITEDQLKRFALMLPAPGTIEQIGSVDPFLIVAVDGPIERTREDPLVGGDPLNPGLNDGGQNVSGDRALRRPHPARLPPKQFLMQFHSGVDVPDGILGIAIEGGGELAVWHRLPRGPLVPQQRQDGVVEGGRGQLDLAAVLKFLVQGDDLGNHFSLPGQQPVFFGLGVVAGLLAKLPQLGILLEQQLMKPRQIVPDLQVAQVLRRHPGERGVGPRGMGESFTMEFQIARERANHRLQIRREKVVDQIPGIVCAEPVGWHPRDIQMPVAAPRDVPLDLHEQARDQIDRAAELGNLLDMEGHPDVVLGRMKPHPRHEGFSSHIIRVVRLMLMPENCQGDRWHVGFLSRQERGR